MGVGSGMDTRRRAPYGSWKSPISSELLAASSVRLSAIWVTDGEVYWIEARPMEKGRCVIVKRSGNGIRDVLPGAYSARSAVHEYGGGAYAVAGSTVYFSHFDDQRLYRIDPGGQPRPITAPPPTPRAYRYADGRVTPDGRTMVCVRERHDGRDAVNDLVLLTLDGSRESRALAAGYDFYSSPRISSDGEYVAWLCWNHPNMPWDGTELWVAALDAHGNLNDSRRVAGGTDESVFQPEWSPEGILHFVSDRTNWWNVYREAEGVIEAVAPIDAECGQPQWVFGLSRYGFLDDGRIACAYSRDGFDHLGIIEPCSATITEVRCPYTSLEYLTVGDGRIWFLGGNESRCPAIVGLDPSTGEHETIRRSSQPDVDARFFSHPRSISFPTEGGLTSHALYYPPANISFEGPPGEAPPLIVMSHGGPTSAAQTSLSLQIQYWTSRGFALVNVNYGGSSGYGRTYRDRLNGAWGVVDVEDCVNAGKYLADRGEADPLRVIIRGSSAGGYTVLRALTSRDFFAAGASYYGIADLSKLVETTHKFEARYLDRLIGPYPEQRKVFEERSPINAVNAIACPVIVFQGLEDTVVPPSQAEAIVGALEAKGLPHAYLSFAGEQHGFRTAETIIRCAQAELHFYGRVFGFAPADHLAESLPRGPVTPRTPPEGNR